MHARWLVNVLAAVSVATLVSAVPLAAAEFTAGNLTILDPWARETLGSQRHATVSMMIANDGPSDDWLVGADSNVAARAEILALDPESEALHGRSVNGIVVPAGRNGDLDVAEYRLELADLYRPLRAGDQFLLRLVFERSGPVTVIAEILDARAIGESPERIRRPRRAR